MRKSIIEPVLSILVVLAIAAVVAWAGSQGGERAFGLPILALCAATAFLVQWVAFIPAYIYQTERFYDLVGSITHITLAGGALWLADAPDSRAVLLAALVVVWAVRLGSFLFRRVSQDGSDRRFTKVKPQPVRFLMYWTTQGLWVFLTLAAALAAITTLERAPLGWLAAVGLALWVSGFAIEVVADAQKRAFRRDPANADRFITTGLWAWSRHPNYFGEVALWVGVAVLALPALGGWQWVTLISPLFVYVLLTRVSGIPMLEASAERRWGDDPSYRAYKTNTPVFWPRPPRRALVQASSNS